MRAVLAFLVACSSSPGTSVDAMPDATVETVLGAACDATHICGNGMICGTCGIATGQCTIACSAAGASGCPAGSYCSRAFIGASFGSHFCVKTCNSDTDCHAANAALSCNGAYQDDGTSGPQICNVSNSIASTHPCN
jgi:hypothetical protein